jgi:capsular polysaccharide transport system permease protein
LTNRSYIIFKNVIFALFLREIKTRFGETKLGYAWVVIEPMLHILFLIFVFSFLSDRMMPQVPFVLFVITGLIPFFLFKNIARALMGSISANMALFAYKPVRPFAVYIARTLRECVIYGAIFGIILAVIWWFDLVPFTIAHPLELMVSTGLIILFAFTFGIVLSLTNHVFPSIKIIVDVLFSLLYFLSGIMLPLWIIPAEYLHYLEWNPMLHLIEMFRESFFSYYPTVNGITGSYPMWWVLIMGFVGMWFYTKRESELRSST